LLPWSWRPPCGNEPSAAASATKFRGDAQFCTPRQHVIEFFRAKVIDISQVGQMEIAAVTPITVENDADMQEHGFLEAQQPLTI